MRGDGEQWRLQVLDVSADGREEQPRGRVAYQDETIPLDNVSDKKHWKRLEQDRAEWRDRKRGEEVIQIPVGDGRVRIRNREGPASLREMCGMWALQDGFELQMGNGGIDGVNKTLDDVIRPSACPILSVSS